MKIDIHTHILPKNWPNLKEKYGYGGWIHLDHHKVGCARMMKDEKFFREVQENLWNPDVRLDECGVHDVNIQVLSTVPVMFSYWAKADHALDLSKLLNDHISTVVGEFPTKFVGLGTIPMQSIDYSIKELERCKNDLNLQGIEIGTNINDQNLNEERFFDIFAACEELSMSIFIHPWQMMGMSKMKKYWLPWLVGMPAETTRAICSMIFGGVFDKFPKLRVAFAHGGGNFHYTLGRIEQGFLQRPDICAVDNTNNPRKYIDKFYIDSLVHSSDSLKFLIDTVGPSQIALGTDYPFPLGETTPGNIIDTLESITKKDKERLFHGTALEWLNLDKNQFI